MRVAVVSDTHVPGSIPKLPETLLSALEQASVDRILHAGDLTDLAVLERLEAIAPTTAVAGNVDPPAVKAKLHRREILELAGHRIGLAHGHQPHALQNHYIDRGIDSPQFQLFYQLMSAQLPGAEIIVFGHFHQPIDREWNGVRFVNPGSIAPPHSRPTFALLDLGDEVGVQRVELPPNG